MSYTLVPTELIVDGAITSAKLDTNISISGTLGVTGELTLATHLNMGDNDKIKIGTGGDLEIYHDGSNSYIANSTGNIYIADTNGSVHIQAKLNEESIVATADGAVTLYHDNSAKLATASGGVTVTGNIANSSGDMTIDVAGDIILDAGGQNIYFDDDGTRFFSISQVSSDVYIGAEVQDKDLIFRGNDGGSTITALTLDMSDAGKALFNAGATFNELVTIDGGSTANTVLALDSSTANTFLKISDSNTNEGNFIGCTTDDLTFFTRNTERFRVDSTGNFLIGATSTNTGGFGSVSPQLLVAGTMPQVALHETDTDKDGYIGISGSTMFIQTADAIPIRFGTSDAERWRIDSSGHFTGASGSKIVQTIASGGGNFLEVTHSGNEAWSLAVQSGTGADDYLDIGINGGTRAISIHEDGKIGIGETSPDSILHLKNTATDGVAGISMENDARRFAINVHGGLSDGLAVYDAGAGATRFFLGSNGRVGIGNDVTSPNAGLVVSNADIRCTAAAVANDANSISMSQESTGGAITARGPSTSERGTISLSVNRSNGGGGIVGLKIENDGGLFAFGVAYASASSDLNYNASTGEIFVVSSSRRYKSNIADLNIDTSKILSLRPVSYTDNESKTNAVGLIAEEVHEEIPELVNYKEIEGYDEIQPDSIKYNTLSVYLLKVIKEQQTIIDDLKTRIETLEG